MNMRILIGQKRYLFYLTGLLTYPRFVDFNQASPALVALVIVLIGLSLLIGLASLLWMPAPDTQSQIDRFLTMEKELYVQKGTRKLKVNLECIENRFYSLINKRYQYAYGYQCAYSFPDRLAGQEAISGGSDYSESKSIASDNRQKRSVNDLVFNFDSDGEVLFVSEEAAAIYGKNSEEFFGKNIVELGDLFGIGYDEWENKLKNNLHLQTTSEYNNGRKIWIFWNFDAVTDSDDRIDLVIATGHEITNIVTTGLSQDRFLDHDTGLLNQQGLQDKLSQLQDVRKAVSFFIDLWHFSRINDYFGYDIGDKIIRVIANELRQFNGDGCFISRFSGDKFVGVIINDTADKLDECLMLLRKFVTSVYEIDGNSIQVDKKIGYALYPDDTDELGKLISLSSLAMKESRPENQFQIIRYQKQMSDILKLNIMTASRLKRALEYHQIEVHFQKTIDTRTSTSGYLEELARWVDPELGYVSPLVLFSVAKEFNMLEQLEKYLIEEAIRNFTFIRHKPDFIHTKLAINLAPSSFMDIGFLDYLNEVVHRFNLDKKDICIEISESTFIYTLDECMKRIEAYKKSGYMIALDDFGKDYSSLAILESLAFDIIKIDKMFIDRVSEEKNQEIVKMIRKIAELSDKEIIAEGVETDNQSSMLIKLGCYMQQGYYFHRPEKMF